MLLGLLAFPLVASRLDRWKTRQMQHTFLAELWLWDARKSDSWTFFTLPADASEDLRDVVEPGRGFGSIRVEVSIGTSTWQTSVFPDKHSGCYVLPVKAPVRKAQSIAAGDQVDVALRAI